MRPAEVLDIGAGAGKYGEMLRGLDQKINLTAVEVEEDYIKKFRLCDIYDDVLKVSAQDLVSAKFIDKKFDVVIMGDVIEHLKKSEGVDLLHFLMYRSRWIILVYPHRYLQNSVEGYTSEAHISVWGESDFSLFDTTKIYEKDSQRLVVIRGYLEENMKVAQVENVINEEI